MSQQKSEALQGSDELFATAEEAANELGVTVNTLYSYVSRKGLRTRQIPGTRSRLYWRADIAKVKASLGKRADPSPRIDDTDITLLTPSAPYYRGRNAIELSETHTLEEVSALLWQTDEQAAFAPTVAVVPREIESLGRLIAHAPTPDKAIALLPFLEQANPRAFDFSHAGMCRTGADVLRWYAAILTDANQPSSAPLHEQVAKFLGASGDVSDLIRKLLVLSADHGFGAGTHAVRSVASTGVTAYRSVLAGLAITAGHRSRLGRTQVIWQFLREIDEGADPHSVVVRRLREGEGVPGFDSPFPYVDHDPRAEALLDSLASVYGETRHFRNFQLVRNIVRESLDLSPSFALANIMFCQFAGLERHRVLYILGRCAGWVAHSIEQSLNTDPPIPAATYRGQLPPAKSR